MKHAAMHRWAQALLLVASVLSVACGDDLPSQATLVQPVFGAPCRYAQCSEHGQCATGADGGPLCLCEVGYAGTRCDRCEPGHHTDARGRCAPDRSCAELATNPCGPNGACSDETGVIECNCADGYEGPRCELCRSGYARDELGDCLPRVLPAPGDAMTPPPQVVCSAEDCNGHGECDDTEGKIACLCDAGYAGMRCGACAAGYRRDDADRCVVVEVCGESSCAGHGACDDVAGQVVCTCDTGYGAPRCVSCAPGFHPEGETCALDQQCLPSTCAGHGACTAAGNTLACACNAGYSGDRCDACALGFHRNASYDCVIDEVCGPRDCNAHGECRDATGEVVCACDPGYRGDACESCAPGFHRTASGLCVLDERCQANSCPSTASCADAMGEISCTCKTGYAGVECEACATGYVRDFAKNTCERFACADNPIPGPTALNFDGITTFPNFENNCITGPSVNSSDLTLSSLGGDGSVWACSKSTLYGLDSQHLFLEAGVENPAELTFTGPIASLSFDYGARSALDLDVLADGQKQRTLTAVRRAHGSLSLSFDPPISVVAFKSLSGITQQLAIDNIAYAPPVCR